MRTRGLRALLVWGGLAVSAVFAYVAVRDVDFDAFWSALVGSAYGWLVPALAVLGVAVALRALRWRLLFAVGSRPPFPAVANALLVGYLFNNILPVRAGEAARVVALHQLAGTSRVEALATAVSERVFDVLSLLLILLVSLPFLPEVTWLRGAAVLALLVGVLALALIVVLARWEERPARRLLRPLSRLPGITPARTESAAVSLVRGLAAFRHPRLALQAFVVTTLSWFALALSGWIVMFCFDLDLGFDAALLVVVATNLAMLLPSSPAAIGVFEAATRVALGGYGIDESSALSYAVVLHAVNFLPYILVGFLVLQRHAAAVRRGDLLPSR